MSELSEEVVRIARTWERTPYRHQGSVKGVACDCLGLARGVWREIYAGADPERVPAYSADWAEASGEETLLEGARRHMVPVAEGTDPEAVLAAAEPGDLLIMRWRPHLPAKHCAILTGKGAGGLPFGWRIIHAYDAAGRVAEVTLAPQWRKRVVAAFRFPERQSAIGNRQTDQEAGSAERATGSAEERRSAIGSRQSEQEAGSGGAATGSVEERQSAIGNRQSDGSATADCHLPNARSPAGSA